jgi:hypothetical protein
MRKTIYNFIQLNINIININIFIKLENDKKRLTVQLVGQSPAFMATRSTGAIWPTTIATAIAVANNNSAAGNNIGFY